MKGIEFIIYWVVAMFCYDLLKKLSKKMTDKSWWVWLFNTPWRLWDDHKVRKDFNKYTKETRCCKNCLKKYSRSGDFINGFAKPECKKFKSERRAKWMNRYKERGCKDFEKLPKL